MSKDLSEVIGRILPAPENNLSPEKLEVARKAREHARALGADCAVAVGGGSTIGLGKAIALDSGLPILAIPTTYAGSEMTPIYGITEGGLKKTGKDLGILNLATTLGQAVGPSITSAVKTVTGTFTAAFAISIVMAPRAAGFVLSLRKVR